MDRRKGEKTHMLFTAYHISSILIHLISKHILQIKRIKRVEIWQMYANCRMCLLLLQGEKNTGRLPSIAHQLRKSAEV